MDYSKKKVINKKEMAKKNFLPRGKKEKVQEAVLPLTGFVSHLRVAARLRCLPGF